MHRLFAGLSVPDDICHDLINRQGGVPGARWTLFENFHVTLTFVGDVDTETAEQVDMALAGIRMPVFDLSLSGFGTFDTGDHPTFLWAGVAHNDALVRLKEKIDHAFLKQKIPFDHRKRYTPHVTQARLNRDVDSDRLKDYVQDHDDYKTHSFTVTEMILYQSHLTKNGAQYEPVGTYPLLQLA